MTVQGSGPDVGTYEPNEFARREGGLGTEVTGRVRLRRMVRGNSDDSTVTIVDCRIGQEVEGYQSREW